MSVPRVILLPSDESPSAEGARAVAAALASRFEAELHDLYVAEVLDSSAEYEWPLDMGLVSPHDRPVPADDEPEVRVVRSVRISDSPGRGILTYAREVGADLIVMGTHGRDGLDRLVHGSTSEHVLRRAECPVLLVPPTARVDSFDEGPIVVAYDFSQTANAAFEEAGELGAALELPLHLLHVVEVTFVTSPYGPVTAPVDYEALRRRAARLLAAMQPPPDVPVRPATRIGTAVEETLEHGREVDASLIVVGSHGRRGVRRLVLGSVAEGIARRAPCPVLVVPAAAARDAAESSEADDLLVAA